MPPLAYAPWPMIIAWAYQCPCPLLPSRLPINLLTITPITSHDRHRPMAYITSSGNGRNRPIDMSSMSSRVCTDSNPNIVVENNVMR